MTAPYPVFKLPEFTGFSERQWQPLSATGPQKGLSQITKRAASICFTSWAENFMIRRFVCGVPTYGLNKVFAALYSQANQNPSIVAGLKDALRTKNYPRDVEFRERFVSTKLYGGGDRIEKTKIILERLEESFEIG